MGVEEICRVREDVLAERVALEVDVDVDVMFQVVGGRCGRHEQLLDGVDDGRQVCVEEVFVVVVGDADGLVVCGHCAAIEACVTLLVDGVGEDLDACAGVADRVGAAGASVALFLAMGHQGGGLVCCSGGPVQGEGAVGDGGARNRANGKAKTLNK